MIVRMLENHTTTTPSHPIKLFTEGVTVEPEAIKQLDNVASLPFIYKHVAVMPDAHWGNGACVGSVIPTQGAVIPAAVGVDLGCGMVAQQTTLSASDLPDSLANLRAEIERAIPVGGPGVNGSWAEAGRDGPPPSVALTWKSLQSGYETIIDKYPKISKGATLEQLCSLGTGNHFIELCLDNSGLVWVMLHSGSRGVGNRIGRFFIEKAKEDMRRFFINLPDENLAYLAEGSRYFSDYIEAVRWAQMFALKNRELMMEYVLSALKLHVKPFQFINTAVNCHHNYISHENHFGQNIWVTRKGAVSARQDELGIIPGSMGAKSYIVRGLGNVDSFTSCSHGAGRAMSRSAAKKKFTIEDHIEATKGVECRKDAGVIDETPGAYKSIDAVMEAQKDLVEVKHTLKAVLCVKG